MEKEVIIKIEGENWKEALEKAFKQANKKAKIDGFRPGKAPREVFIKKYGMSALYMDAAEFCLDEAYEKMAKENESLQVVAQPELSVNAVTDDYIEFKFVLTLKPEVTLGKYSNLKVEKQSIEVSEEEITNSLNHLREEYIENINKDGLVSTNDVTIIDFEGFCDGMPFEGGKGNDYSLKIGSNTFIPGFEEQLIGMKKDETKDINVTFPADYHAEDLKGKEVIFKVTIKEIKEQKLPELNEEFFEDLGYEGITDELGLRKQIKENLLVGKEKEAENKYVDDLLLAASKETKIEIPEIMIKEETNRIIKQYEEHLKMQGINLEMFYQFTNSNEEALREQMKEEAVSRVTYRLMLEAIAKNEKIEISEEEVKEEASKLAEKYQMKEEEFLKEFGGLDMIKYDLTMRRAIEVLKK